MAPLRSKNKFIFLGVGGLYRAKLHAVQRVFGAFRVAFLLQQGFPPRALFGLSGRLYHVSGFALNITTSRRFSAFSLVCLSCSDFARSLCSALWQALHIVSRFAGSSRLDQLTRTGTMWCTVVAGVTRPARLHTWHK